MLSTIRDPVFVKKDRHSHLDTFFLRFLNDERDLPFIYLSLQVILIIIPIAIILYLPLLQGWAWYGVATIYLLSILLYFMGPFVLMLHNTSHCTFFKRKYNWANNIIPWLLGPFFGQSPETYFSHHVGMHHVENNLEEDCSTTMFYQRDSFRGFMMYYLEFFFIGLIELTNYFRRKKRRKLMKKVIRGEFSFFLLCAALCFVSWQATLFVFIIPFVFARFAMMVGNWGQHAFIDADDPANNYRNSITCINSVYNRRCFNDGYHIGHHLQPRLHWTEMAPDFLQHKHQYAEQRSVVFEGIDYFYIWLLLMLKRYDVLAKYFVNVGDIYKTDEEVVNLLKTRTRRIDKQLQDGRVSFILSNK